MPAKCTCLCKNGSTISGTAAWLPEKTDRMDVSELIGILNQLRGFACYYREAFLEPMHRLQEERKRLDISRRKMKSALLFSAVFPLAVTLAWLLSTVMIDSGYSTASFALALLTFVCAGCFLLMMFRFSRRGEAYRGQLTAVEQQIQELSAQRDQKMFNEYRDQLISGFILLPEEGLCVEALDGMIHSLETGDAVDLQQARKYCSQTGRQASYLDLILKCTAMEPIVQENVAQRTAESGSSEEKTPLQQISENLRRAAEHLARMQEAVSDVLPCETDFIL